MENGKILIVDDELDICLLLSAYFNKNGFRVVYETSIRNAVTTAEKLRPDIIFLDHNLPDGYGIKNIHVFKSISACQVYIISAMSNLKEEAIRNGADYFFEKPLSLNRIKEILELDDTTQDQIKNSSNL
jgi:DNA-binding response OmpR family regulator